MDIGIRRAGSILISTELNMSQI